MAYAAYIVKARQESIRESVGRILRKRPDFRYEFSGVKVHFGEATDLHSNEHGGYTLKTDGKSMRIAAPWFELTGPSKDVQVVKSLAAVSLNHHIRKKKARECSCKECTEAASNWLACQTILADTKVYSTMGWTRSQMVAALGSDAIPEEGTDDWEALSKMSFESLAKYIHDKRHDGKKEEPQPGEGDDEALVEEVTGEGEDGKDGKSSSKNPSGPPPAPGTKGGGRTGPTGATDTVSSLEELSVDEEELAKLKPPPDYIEEKVMWFLDDALASVFERSSKRPDRRLPPQADILYPFEKRGVPIVAISVDVSGSVTMNPEARKRIAQLACTVQGVAERYGAVVVEVAWGSSCAIAEPKCLTAAGGFKGMVRRNNIWGELGGLCGGGTCGVLPVELSAKSEVDATIVITDGDLGDWDAFKPNNYEQKEALSQFAPIDSVFWVIGVTPGNRYYGGGNNVAFYEDIMNKTNKRLSGVVAEW